MSYAIGVAEPTSISVDTYGTGKIGDNEIIQLVREHFDLRPKGLIAMLDLKRPIYQQTAAYGHFGRSGEDFTWESTDKADVLAAAFFLTAGTRRDGFLGIHHEPCRQLRDSLIFEL